MGSFHSLALDSQGQAWSTGSPSHGMLGRDNKQTPYDQFGKVTQEAGLTFTAIFACNGTSYFLLEETSALFYCGKQEGLKDQLVPKEHPSFKGFAIK